MTLMIKINFIVTCIILVFIMWQDIFFRKITHSSLLLLFVSLIPLIFLQQQWPNVMFAILTLMGGFLLFVARLWGGGDAKLVAILALAFQGALFYDFLFLTAFLGGTIAIFGLVFFRNNLRSHGVPYGVAISLAFIFVYPLPSLFY
ncbi:peptidase A24 [Hafnia paralvei]|uniref:A24 family peptidase n=1 Tax=Hafnia paralvei TaxID=546367 RepID=UPI00076B0E29|nr:prepilin peptidase [Hafnia paralvei]AMH19481.1 peptidase A24 [Hafnia paralvei]